MGIISRRVIRRTLDLSASGARTRPAAGALGLEGPIVLGHGESIASVELRPSPGSAAWTSATAEVKGIVDPEGGTLNSFAGSAQTLATATRVRAGIDVKGFHAIDVETATAETGVAADVCVVVVRET